MIGYYWSDSTESKDDISSKIERLKLCTASPSFLHEWANQSLFFEKVACKHCDVDKPAHDKQIEELESLKLRRDFVD